MTEDELLLGLTGAMDLAGWTWTHIRDSKAARLMGSTGVPDLLAVNEGRRVLLAWELKSATGQPTYEQVAWLRGLKAVRSVDARIIRPAEYDQALAIILRGDPPEASCVVCGRMTELRILDPRSGAGLCADHEPS